ncbi:MAG: tripartite tricarboxylate transporter TctB family protein [Streptosporangiaceae bacterium]
MRPRRLDADLVVGGVVFLFALALLAASMRIQPAPSRTAVLGPKVMPVAVSGVLAAAAVVLAARGVWRSRRTAPEPGPPREPTAADAGKPAEEDRPAPEAAAETVEEPPDAPGRARRFLGIAAMLLVYILIFIPVGYLISTFVFLAAASTYIDPRKWIRNLVFAAVFSLVVYLAFTRALHVELPPGLLG